MMTPLAHQQDARHVSIPVGQKLIIIGIVGILDFRRRERGGVWKYLQHAFTKEFTDAEFIVEHALYLPWQHKKIRVFADSIVQRYDTGEELMLVGYSLGGIIACTIAPLFKNSRVVRVVTIGTPHKLPFFYHMLNTEPPILSMPLCTFAGIFDPIVPWFLTSTPQSTHTNIWSDHVLGFIISERPASIIARIVKYLR